jgi:hypothetical protein
LEIIPPQAEDIADIRGIPSIQPAGTTDMKLARKQTKNRDANPQFVFLALLLFSKIFP